MAYTCGLKYEQLKLIVVSDAFDTLEHTKGAYRDNRGKAQLVLSYQAVDPSKPSGKKQVKLTHTLEQKYNAKISDRAKRKLINDWRAKVLADARTLTASEIDPTQTVAALVEQYITEKEKLGEVTKQGDESRRRGGAISHTTATKRRWDIQRIKDSVVYAMPLSEVTHKQIQDLVIELAQRYSGETVNSVHALLTMVFRWALGKNADNPCDGVGLPSIDHHPKGSAKAGRKAGLNILPESEVAPFVDRCTKSVGTRSETILVGALLALTCGLRTEECCGLMWKDVDLDSAVPSVHIGRAAVRYMVDGAWVYEIGATKTAKSVRDIPLYPQAVAVLKGLRERRVQLIGEAKTRETFVLGDDNGDFRHTNTLSDSFRKHAKKNGIVGCLGVHLSMHALRDTYASRLVDRGESIVKVSRLLGHSNVKTTQDRYLDCDQQSIDGTVLKHADLFGTIEQVSEQTATTDAQLTADELELLLAFRAVNTESKARILRYARGEAQDADREATERRGQLKAV